MRKTIDLQLFADAIRGKKIVYLYRLKKDAAKNAATALAFTTENGRTYLDTLGTLLECTNLKLGRIIGFIEELKEEIRLCGIC